MSKDTDFDKNVDLEENSKVFCEEEVSNKENFGEEVSDKEVEVSEERSIAMEILHEFKKHDERMDEHNKRLIGELKVMAFAIVAIVAAFLIYLYQYDFQNYSQDGSGYNNINTGTQGDVNNGAEIPSSEEEGR